MLVKYLLGFCLLCLALPVQAQGIDTAARARELLGFTGDVPIPPPAPVYHPGDSEMFWVSKAGEDAPTRISAELAAAAPTIYLWVEYGLDYDPAGMQQMADQLAAIWNVLQLRDNYGQLQVVPRSVVEFNTRAKLALPDVDNDPHLFILYARDLRDLSNTAYNPNNSLMAEVAPGGYSNQRELLVVNASALPAVALHNGIYAGVLARQMVALLSYYHAPAQPDWLTNALGWFIVQQIQNADLTADAFAPFLEAPNTSLVQPPPVGGAGAEFGAQQLFFQYLLQRFSGSVFRDLLTQPGRGLQPLDAALARNNVADMVTGDILTGRDVFADFALANLLNGLFAGDGRYLYRNVDFGETQAAVFVLRDNLNATFNDGVVNQWGTRYVALTSAAPAAVTLDFAGQPTTPRLPMPDTNRSQFYWTDAAAESTTLTRAFDLRGVTQAALTFDAWYSLTEGWQYAYVEVSTDGGATWDILPATTTRTFNPYGAAYGAGFTGVSNPAAPPPFPYLGVGLAADGLTVTEIIPDGPAAATELQAGDTIAGFDGQPWPDGLTLLGWLATKAAGDAVNLYVQRGSDFLELPVTLGAHPTRTFAQAALWLPQTVDLSAYAGQDIRLRFQTISLPGRASAGFAVDNLAVAAIGFRDDAEGAVPGWTLDGWQQTRNQTAQTFAVQAAYLSAASSRVQQLIAPGDTATSGTWPFTLAANDFLILAISGLNDDTSQPARFALTVRAETAAPTITPAR